MTVDSNEMISFINEKYDVDLKPYWKNILIFFLDVPGGFKFYDKLSFNNKSIDAQNIAISERELHQFADKAGYLSVIKKVLENFDELPSLSTDKGDLIFRVKYHTSEMFDLLAKWGYLESQEESIGDTKYKHWFFTSKGIDTALKLEEHQDNKNRFNEQIIISETLKSNSTKSVIISSLAAIISCAALMLTYSIFSVNNERLNIAKENQTENTYQKVILQKAVDDISTLKAIELKLTNLEKEQIQKSTEKIIKPKTKQNNLLLKHRQ
jgi:hypothetical protein